MPFENLLHFPVENLQNYRAFMYVSHLGVHENLVMIRSFIYLLRLVGSRGDDDDGDNNDKIQRIAEKEQDKEKRTKKYMELCKLPSTKFVEESNRS